MSERAAIKVDGVELDVTHYRRMHGRRITETLDLLRKFSGRRIVELGAHPWVMTSALVDDPDFDVLATVSAEEATLWPDDFGVVRNDHELVTLGGRRQTVRQYLFNVERRLVTLDEEPDAVLACEIVEHLVRAPHILFLNINRWLSIGGMLVVTTPNGSQFMNPFRLKPRMPAFRAHCYERHSYVYRLADLVELVELCGFEVVESGFWNPYPSQGTRSVARGLAKLPGRYFSEKFERSLVVVARKSRALEVLPRTPRVYELSSDWEHITPNTAPASGQGAA